MKRRCDRQAWGDSEAWDVGAIALVGMRVRSPFIFSQLGAIALTSGVYIAPDQFLKSDRIIRLSGNIGMRSHLHIYAGCDRQAWGDSEAWDVGAIAQRCVALSLLWDESAIALLG